MARGGYRPGSGPAKGTKYKPRKRDTVVADGVEKKHPVIKKPRAKKEVVNAAPVVSQDIADAAAQEDLTPLEFMLREMNNPAIPWSDRARMATSAAPFCHARAGEGKGKKEDKADAAKKAASGRFAPSPGPKIIPIQKQG